MKKIIVASVALCVLMGCSNVKENTSVSKNVSFSEGSDDSNLVLSLDKAFVETFESEHGTVLVTCKRADITTGCSYSNLISVEEYVADKEAFSIPVKWRQPVNQKSVDIKYIIEVKDQYHIYYSRPKLRKELAKKVVVVNGKPLDIETKAILTNKQFNL